MALRQIVLDTETTGLEPAQGHRVIEIGAIELVDRRATGNHFHFYLQPDREIDQGAMQVHGITQEFLADKPRFGDIAADLLEYLGNAELIIHNAPFDVGFLDHEFRRIDSAWIGIAKRSRIIDTLELARQMHPGQKNNLDALCKRYSVDNTHRELHGALLDSQLLAEIYLSMTGGQVSLSLGGNSADDVTQPAGDSTIRRVGVERQRLQVIVASGEELLAHEQRLKTIDKASGGGCVWNKLTQ
jgi:DNA polymerase-3 subunit epsilon